MNHFKLPLAICSILMLISCSNGSTKENSVYSIDESSLYEPINIYIDIASEHKNNDLWYVKEFSEDGSISFKPTSEYYDLYTNPSRMVLIPERDFNYSDYIENPKFNIFISNNSDKNIAIDKIELEVSESKLDDFPYIFLQQYYTIANGLMLQNESWTSWGTMTLEYTLLHKGESFSGNYTHKIKIPYFEEYAYIDFLSDIISEGFDPSKIEQYLDDTWDEDKIYHKPVFGNSAKSDHLIFRTLSSDLEITQDVMNDISYPFEFGYVYGCSPYIFARLFAKMSFSNHSFTKEFSAIIPITCVYPGGANDELVDEFSIELKPEGKNYKITLPYISKITSNDSERLQIIVKCVKSSKHNFKISITTSDGKIFSSKPINFYNLNGRHSSYYILPNEL